MLHPGRIVLVDLIGRLPSNVAGCCEKVLLAVMQALSSGSRAALDGTAVRHVGLSSGDGGGGGLRDSESLLGLGSELLLRGELRIHCKFLLRRLGLALLSPLLLFLRWRVL